MKDEMLVNVTNRNSGYTGYIIPDTGVRRNFTLGETKKISLGELKALQYVPGGEYILRNCLLINDKNALEALNMSDVEPEYFYTEKEVRTLLIESSLDQLDDALTFAPEGVIEMIKDMAVKEEIPDIRKRDLITEKTGFNVSNAIMVNHIVEEDVNADAAKDTPNKRKAAPISVEESQPAARKSTIIIKPQE